MKEKNKPKNKITKIIKKHTNNLIFSSSISNYSPFYTSLEILKSLCNSDDEKNEFQLILDNLPNITNYDNTSTKFLIASPHLEEPFKKVAKMPPYIKDYLTMFLRKVYILDKHNKVVDQLYDISDKVLLLEDAKYSKKQFGANSRVILHSDKFADELKKIQTNPENTPLYIRKYSDIFFKYINKKYKISTTTFLNEIDSPENKNILDNFIKDYPIFSYREFFKQIRNCISHVCYKINNNNESIQLCNKNDDGEINFNIEIPFSSLMTLCDELSNFNNYFGSIPEIYDHYDLDDLQHLKIENQNDLYNYLKRLTVLNYKNIQYDKNNHDTMSTIDYHYLEQTRIEKENNNYSYNRFLKNLFNLKCKNAVEKELSEEDIHKILLKINKIPNFYSYSTSIKRNLIQKIIVNNHNNETPFTVIKDICLMNTITPKEVNKFLNIDNNMQYYYDTIIIFMKTLLNSIFSIYFEKNINNEKSFENFNLSNIDEKNSNKDIFMHIRDSLIHGWIKIELNDNILDSKITIIDSPDNLNNPTKFNYHNVIVFKDIINLIKDKSFIETIFKNDLCKKSEYSLKRIKL